MNSALNIDNVCVAQLHILIVTYNAMPWLPNFCHRAEQLTEGWRIVVVDNASTDGTAEVLEKDHKHIHLIRNKKNLGFGRANNKGMLYALEQGADYVYLMNQDSEISIQDIAELVRLHQKFPEYRIISPVHTNGDGTALDYSFGASCAASGLDCLAPARGESELPDLFPVDWGIAAGWLLPRTTLMETGGFNPLYFHYGEDEDYVHRVLYHGGKLAVASNVFMRHHRTRKGKRKPFPGRFIDRLLLLTAPGRAPASPARVLRCFAGPLFRQVLTCNIHKAAFLMRGCRALLPGDAPGSIRDKVKQKGATFL